ncbi:MAG: hypothetical protein ACE5J9_03980 [Methanosarcinales archaeon]
MYTSKEYTTVKLGYVSLALECLVVSDDHLLNWFLYPNEFLSRSKRHSFFRSHRKVRNDPLLYAYTSMSLEVRNIALYLKSEKSISEVLDKIYYSLDKIFRRAESVRNTFKKI